MSSNRSMDINGNRSSERLLGDRDNNRNPIQIEPAIEMNAINGAHRAPSPDILANAAPMNNGSQISLSRRFRSTKECFRSRSCRRWHYVFSFICFVAVIFLTPAVIWCNWNFENGNVMTIL